MAIISDFSEDSYGQGYAAGKQSAHFAVRQVLGDGHSDDCGCDPCLTVRIVAAQLAERWLGDLICPG